MKYLTYVFVLVYSFGFAQKHDFIWRNGNKFEPGNYPLNGINNLDFLLGRVEVTSTENLGASYTTNTTLSNSNGDFLFFTNGIELYRQDMSIVPSSENFNYHPYLESWKGFGMPIQQGVIALPWPDSVDTYVLFHVPIEYGIFPIVPDTLVGISENFYFSTLKGSSAQNIVMVDKRKLLLIDTLVGGNISATKQANGRDWWVFVRSFDGQKMYRITLDKDGSRVDAAINLLLPSGANYETSGFSPDGNWHIRFLTDGYTFESQLFFYPFDRCNGTFGAPIIHNFTSEFLSSSHAFSPNGRFLYTCTGYKIFQFDLWENDIIGSMVEVGDNNDLVCFQNQGALFFGQNAPDGKIYWSNTIGCPFYSVINNPNLKGVECGFQARGLSMDKLLFRSIPYYPNYRLGPEDGSVCDSLGIDNVPMAWWGYDVDTLAKAVVQFRDNSFYKPTSRFWDFGDGHTSTEEYPIHYYKIGRVYEACLTVSNEYGTDELCRTFDFTKAAIGGFTSGEAPPSGLLLEDEEAFDLAEGVLVYPNPTSNELYIKIPDNLPIERIRLLDMQGRVHMTASGVTSSVEWSVGHLPQGVYVLELVDEKGRTGRRRVVVNY